MPSNAQGLFTYGSAGRNLFLAVIRVIWDARDGIWVGHMQEKVPAVSQVLGKWCYHFGGGEELGHT